MAEQLSGMVIVASLGLAPGWPHRDAITAAGLPGIVALGLLAFTTAGILIGVSLDSPDLLRTSASRSCSRSPSSAARSSPSPA
jgi:hypothetical protein